MQGWLSIFIMIALGAGFALAMVVLSGLFGPHHPTPEKAAPYECGMPPVGDARERQSVKFYLVAMIFLLFDIDRKSTRLNSSHLGISYAVFCLKKKNKK